MIYALYLSVAYHTISLVGLNFKISHTSFTVRTGGYLRSLLVISFLSALIAIDDPPLRRKRKHNSVDVSYSVFKIL